MTPAIRIDIAEHTQVSEARRSAHKLASQLGFSESQSGALAVVVTEIASNIAKHAGQGFILLDKQPGGIHVYGLDQGRGMVNVTECMRDGHSTAGSPGTGLGAIRRMSQRSDIYSTPGKGTVVHAFCATDPRSASAPAAEDIAGIILAYPGCVDSGDDWTVVETSGRLAVALADGLGHGTLAADAAAAATKTVRSSPLVAEQLMQASHVALHGTRGAAMAIAEFSRAASVLTYTGVGNITGIVEHPSESRHLVSSNGIVGHRMERVQAYTYPCQPNSLLILHSDGLRTRWKLNDYPGLGSKSPAVIAGVMMRDALRGTDDACVVVARLRVAHA